MEFITSSNLAIRFGLELGSLAALGYAGFQTDRGWVVRLLVGVGAPLLAAAIWGMLVAPAASGRLPDPWRLIPEFTVFGSAAVVLVYLCLTRRRLLPLMIMHMVADVLAALSPLRLAASQRP